MLTNYLRIALRTLRKHPGYAFINVFGLAVGLACVLLILLFVRDELRYDRFHENADRIYRVLLDARIGEQEIRGPVAPALMAETLVRDYPEVVQATRLFSFMDEALVRYESNRFVENRFFFADSTVFDVFTFPLLQGDPQTALAEPGTVVLTASTAHKYFGETDPMGRTIRVNDRQDYRVTGVMADVPANSHMHFDFLASLVTREDSRNPLWVSNNFHTYLVLAEDHSPDALEAKFPDLIRTYAGPQVQEILGITPEQFYASGGRFEFHLQPLTDIHLHSHLDYEIEPNGDIAYVYAFAAIAVLILLIACINFMNLATARSAGRAREVGMRKVLGSSRGQLRRQFLMESVLLSSGAMIVALGLVAALLPLFNDVSGKTLALRDLGGGLMPVLLGLAAVVGLLAGTYPAFFLASFRIVNVLKGRLRTGGQHAWMRSGLVVFQFVISIALMIGTAVVYRQVEFVQNTRLGFDTEHVVVIERADALGDQQEAFKQALLQQPDVVSAAAASSLPGRDIGDSSFLPEGTAAENLRSLRLIWGDYDLPATLDLTILAGRAFSRDHPTDSAGILLNEAALREIGWEPDEAVGKRLLSPSFGGPEEIYTVVGVVNDFHFQSLHQQIRPLGLFLSRNQDYLAVRLRPGADLPAALAALETRWQAFAPDDPFTYAFLDQDVDALYAADQRTGILFAAFAVLAIAIACLGLFGLAAFMAEQRTKEIGVRKVLGASVTSLVLLLSREFTRLVGLAFVVAAPIAYFAMHRWLEDFAYRIDISWTIFLSAGLSTLLVAVLTVSYQSVRAALADPVKSLRQE